MSLDVSLMQVKPTSVFDCTISSDLMKIAKKAGIYSELWFPHSKGIFVSSELVPSLELAISTLENNPERFKKYNPKDDGGVYASFLAILHLYLSACKEHPTAVVIAADAENGLTGSFPTGR